MLKIRMGKVCALQRCALQISARQRNAFQIGPRQKRALALPVCVGDDRKRLLASHWYVHGVPLRCRVADGDVVGGKNDRVELILSSFQLSYKPPQLIDRQHIYAHFTRVMLYTIWT